MKWQANHRICSERLTAGAAREDALRKERNQLRRRVQDLERELAELQKRLVRPLIPEAKA